MALNNQQELIYPKIQPTQPSRRTKCCWTTFCQRAVHSIGARENLKDFTRRS